MAISRKLSLYLEMERLMLALEGDNVQAADTVRDLMDPLWYDLEDEDRVFLDNRTISSVHTFEWVTVPMAACVVQVLPAGPSEIPAGEIADWKTAA